MHAYGIFARSHELTGASHRLYRWCMCRMAARVSVQPQSPAFELLEASHSLRKQSLAANYPFSPSGTGPHNDGCGIAWFERGTINLEKRGREECWDETFIEDVRSLQTTAWIAHNRAASQGLVVDTANAHPYLSTIQGEPVAFCHNGGVRSLMEAAKARQVSDSCILLEHLSKELRVLAFDELREFLHARSASWEFTSINGLLLSQYGVFAWRCFEEKPQTLSVFNDYYTLSIRDGADDICIASEPLNPGASWRHIPNRTLVEVSTSHGTVVLREAMF